MSIIQLSPSDMYEFITRALGSRQVPYVAGPPAIGKSQVVHQVANDANALMIDLRLSQILSEDMTGLPERNGAGKATYLPFETFPLEGDTVPEGYSGWLLFLDELSSATEEVLAAAYSLILDRTVGGKKLHDKCLVVAAGNRASDSAIARELPDTLITRMLPAEMKVSTKDWLAWATRPESPTNEAVVDFITKNPTKLYAFVDQGNREELETYATPRGWEKACAHVNAHERLVAKTAKPRTDAAGIPMPMDPDEKAMAPIDDITFNLIAACVGPMAAQQFREEYDEAIQLPYPWEVAQSPSSTRIPTTGVGKAKMMNELAKYFNESDDQSRDSVLSYVNRVGGDYTAMFYNELKGHFGETPSDKKLLDTVAKRLSIDPLLGTAPGGESGQSPF
ncbi:putative AAA superfamily ATPase [Sulfitobacter phage vB_SupP_AX]|nr:putative AAA superfamily ATPase [Sulfitobacter phage vB_SupP_AX]